MDLKWEPPKSDGGAPIEKYVIEKKDRFGTDWEKAAEVPGSKTEAKVAGLKENTELQFRVVAVNKAGPSEPSEPTQMHTVKHRKCKCHYSDSTWWTHCLLACYCQPIKLAYKKISKQEYNYYLNYSLL